MDLKDHLERLEKFSARLSGVYPGLADKGDTSAAEALPPWYDRVQQAVAFLSRSGARPKVAELRDGPKGALLGVKLQSYDAEALGKFLQGLGSARAVAEWVEQGVAAGAISVRGDRLFLLVEPAHDRGDSPAGRSPERGIDATGCVVESAHRAMERETASLMGVMDNASAAGGGQVVQFRKDLALDSRQILQAADEAPGPLGDLKRTRARPRVVAGAAEVGPDPRFIVTGAPVELADGTYYPVEPADAHSRRALAEMGATGIRVNRRGERTFVRAEHAEVLPSSSRTRGEDRGPAADAESADPRAERIGLAYRLLRGMTATPGEGRPLDAGLASRMEQFFGESLGDVRIYTGRMASEVTEALSVEALSMGHHVVIPDRLLQSASGEGERVLVHELTHVRQHRQAPDATRSAREAEADSVVSRFVRGKGMGPSQLASVPRRAPAPPPAQSASMPSGVYAATQRQVQKPTVRQKDGDSELRSEKTLRRITQEVNQRNRQALEDQLDRQG